MKPITEQVVMVTGATDGIGRISARKLAQMGATVLVHGRSRDKCEATIREIRESTGNEKLKTYARDLSSLSEVQALAKDVESDFSSLQLLINNAGVGPRPGERPLSRDGHELCFAVNFLAPFLLSQLLVPALRKGAPARIVNITSAAQRPLDFDNVMLKLDYDPYQAYAQSKLALAMFTFDLAERLKHHGITVNCLHPGSLLDTKMVREGGYSPRGTAESGAEVEVYVATSPDLDGTTGRYFKERETARAHEQAYDIEARKALWRLGQQLCGIGAAGD